MPDEETHKKRITGRKNTEAKTLRRRERILNHIRRYGEDNLQQTEWADKENVTQSTISRDFDWLREHRELSVIDTEKIKFNVHDDILTVKRLARRNMVDANNPHDQREWAKLLLNTDEQLTRFLEDFGAKPKAATPVTTDASWEAAFRAYQAEEQKEQVKHDERRTPGTNQ